MPRRAPNEESQAKPKELEPLQEFLGTSSSIYFYGISTATWVSRKFSYMKLEGFKNDISFRGY